MFDCAKKVFKQDPVSAVNVDEVVALEHAYAAYKSDELAVRIQKKSVSKLNVSEVTTMFWNNFGWIL